MLLSTLLASKAAVAVGSAVIVLGGGTAAVAAVHVLPAALDHGTVAGADDQDESGDPSGGSKTDTESPSSQAPSTESPSSGSPSSESADPTVSTSSSPHGPDATGPAAFGLCNAYSHGGLPPQSVAYQSLARAAGAGTIEAYCATVEHPGGKPSPSTTETSASTRHGKPTAAPSAKASHGKGRSHAKHS